MIRVYPIAWKAKEIIPVGNTIFPGGEAHWQCRPSHVAGLDIVIDARVCSAEEMMRLLTVTDAIRACRPRSLSLFIPYFPGARQDRREPGGPLSVALYARLINGCGFDNVIILDPHSEVTPALVDRCVVIHADRLFNLFFHSMFDAFEGVDYIIAPDRGAVKRAGSVATFLHRPLIYAEKIRNPETGDLSGFTIDRLPKVGRYLVVDDICDGGGTFLGLAEAFREQEIGKSSPLMLYVTHGIFSRGMRRLNAAYDRIVTTDSVVPLLRPQVANDWVMKQNRCIELDYFWNEASISLTKF